VKTEDQNIEVLKKAGYALKAVKRCAAGEYQVILLTDAGAEISGTVKLASDNVSNFKYMSYVSEEIQSAITFCKLDPRALAHILVLIDDFS